MHALLTLDLPGATPDQRKKFNEKMDEEKWVKLREDTVWTIRFIPTATEAQIVQTTKRDVAAAAQHAGLKNYRCVVAVSTSAPTSFP
jgi:hypothetical protein